MHVFRCRTLPLSYDYYNIFHRFSQLLLIPHDMPVDAVITEQAWFLLKGSAFSAGEC